MRKLFAQEIEKLMSKDKNIVINCPDLGYGIFDLIRTKYREQFFIYPAAEFSVMAICCGMSINKKIPLFYSITPFTILRPFEIIKLYLNDDTIPVKMIGVGRDFDYKENGNTHCLPEDKEVMSIFKNIESFWPKNNKSLLNIIPDFIYNGKPSYLNLSRFDNPK